MSFSSQVKSELCSLSCENSLCCQRAEAYGSLYFGRGFSKSDMSLMTDYDFVAERYARSLFTLAGVVPASTRTKSGKYLVSVDTQEDRFAVLNELGYSGSEPTLRIDRTNIENDCCVGAFIRGAFLSSGIVTDPKKEYHLEFCVGYRSKARYFADFLKESSFDATPKLSDRNGQTIVYFKDSSQIEDILTVMGAQVSVMELIGEKIFKNVRNNVNRKVNCDNANIKKTCDAARTQITAIEKLISNGKIERLPPELKEIAKLRLENPEMSLSELGQCLKTPVSRSSVNRRLKKLTELAGIKGTN